MSVCGEKLFLPAVSHFKLFFFGGNMKKTGIIALVFLALPLVRALLEQVGSFI